MFCKILLIGASVAVFLTVADKMLMMLNGSGVDFWLGVVGILLITGGAIVWLKRYVLLVLVVLPLLLSACTRVQPGNVGIKVNNFGSERGVQDYTLSTGLVFYLPIMTIKQWNGVRPIVEGVNSGLLLNVTPSK